MRPKVCLIDGTEIEVDDNGLAAIPAGSAVVGVKYEDVFHGYPTKAFATDAAFQVDGFTITFGNTSIDLWNK